MIETIELKKDLIIPDVKEVMINQGIPKGITIKEDILTISDKAKNFFVPEANPLCIVLELTKEEFEIIYNGEGNNDEESPIKNIFLNSDWLSLYAITLGSEISSRIKQLFSENDFALASMVDSYASVAVDHAVSFLENHFYQRLINKKIANNRSIVFGYSPGYCGWNIESQKKLFRKLQPESIGITLNESCLMTPIKSVTGVLICGDKTIHDFRNNFGFCALCKTESCLERINQIYSK